MRQGLCSDGNDDRCANHQKRAHLNCASCNSIPLGADERKIQDAQVSEDKPILRRETSQCPNKG